MISKQNTDKLAEWFDYAERFRSRDIVINSKVTEPNFSIGYVENQDSPPALPVNRRMGKIVMFDHLPNANFQEFVSLTETSNNEKLKRSTVLMGQNVYHENITSKLGGRGVRVGGVNNNDYLITLTFALIPTDEEYLQLFEARQTIAGGVEEAIVNYWADRYGLMTEEELDYKINELIAKNDRVVTKAGLRAKMHDLRSKNF